MTANEISYERVVSEWPADQVPPSLELFNEAVRCARVGDELVSAKTVADSLLQGSWPVWRP